MKLTKTELRSQQNRLSQLEKYLPTLQLKKAMLQAHIQEARLELAHAEEAYAKSIAAAESYSALLTEELPLDLLDAVKIQAVHKHYENIAGTEVPYFTRIDFADFSYDLFETPAWVDGVILGLRALATARAKIDVAREKKAALEKELREVSIRVNLFDKILIPRALAHIKKIKVFLGDQQLASVSQAKVAKDKIVARSHAH